MAEEMTTKEWRDLVGIKVAPAELTQPRLGSTQLGPDFPDAAGEREKGKFRKSRYPRLTSVAVVNDDGSSITMRLEKLLMELIEEVKALREEVKALRKEK